MPSADIFFYLSFYFQEPLLDKQAEGSDGRGTSASHTLPNLQAAHRV